MERKAVEIAVPADPPKPNGTANEKRAKETEQKLSEEDARIKEQVELLVTRAADPNPVLAKTAVEQLVELLRTSSASSVASVPKPLKYVRSLYPELEQALQASMDPLLTRRLHDVLSFIAMTLVTGDSRRVTLEHKLKGTVDDLAQWGHEYQRFLAGAVAEEWKERIEKGTATTPLVDLVRQIVQYMVAHQDEPTAIDLLLEVDDTAQLVPLVDENNYRRITNYLAATTMYLTRPTNAEVLDIVFAMYMKMHAYHDAVVTALRLKNRAKIEQVFTECTDDVVLLQMALTCARCFLFLSFDAQEQELLEEANGNMQLSQLYRHSAKLLDSLAPKAVEEVCKPADASPRNENEVSSASRALASGFINCGYGTDQYLTKSDTILFNQVESRVRTIIASLGLLHLWDYTEGLQAIDRYFYSESAFIKSGACIASGIIMCGIKNPFDPALGLLSDNVLSPIREVAFGAVLGLGFAYAGTAKEEVKELLVPILANGEESKDTQCMAGYALAMVFVGTADSDITETILNCLVEMPEARLTDPCVNYLILALGCMVLGCQELADTLIEATWILPASVRRYVEVIITSCAFAGTGNVLVVQKLFHIIAEVEEEEEEGPKTVDVEAMQNISDAKHAAAESGTSAKQTNLPSATVKPETGTTKGRPSWTEKMLNYRAAAVLGIGLVAVGEELGEEMVKRAITHVLLVDTVKKNKKSLSGRTAVPLVYAMLSASNPNMTVVETLNRLAHDSDNHTAACAIFALGIVSAGSNNAWVADKLRSLTAYYKSDSNDVIFMIRLAQSLCAMGKGHLTISPLMNDRSHVCMPSVMGLLGALHTALYYRCVMLDTYELMFLSLVPSIRPRMVLAVDDKMTPVDGVQVRVGPPVDTVALPGKPKTITGFQTQTTPVLLSATDRVEVANSTYKPVLSSIQGIFVVQPRPQTE